MLWGIFGTPSLKSGVSVIQSWRPAIDLKGEVGRQYTTKTTFKDVLRRLKDSFRNLTRKVWM